MAEDDESGYIRDQMEDAIGRARGVMSAAAERDRVPEEGERMSAPQSALGGLLNGIVQGYQIRQKMLADAADREDASRKAAIEDSNASFRDIQNQMMLQGAGRPVNNGMVEQPTAGFVQQSMTTPAPPPPRADPEPPIAIPLDAEGIADLPTPETRIVPASTTLRKADPSRTVSYTDRQGNKTQTELYSDQEQQDRAAAAAGAKKRATSTMLTLSPEDQQKYGLPAQVPIPDEHVANYLNSRLGSETRESIAAGAQAGQNERNDARLQSREGIAANTLDNRLETNAANNQTKTANTNSVNALRKAIADSAQKNANSRAANAQTGANTRQANRLTATQTAQQQKQLQALQAKEDDLQAARVQLKQDIGNADTPALQKKTKQGQLTTNAYQIQSYQTRKAAVVGAGAPPKEIQGKIPEGQQATAPDGHVWQKKDGIVYFVK